ncbi:MAG: efflux RND transporter periplasmic adaptor subunit [Deltaproteobacteria bacterium]|nr:MAG: efflux RND transporter periplasmic adaptor subunit [Deltaproteobacteria bacterium]
MTLPPWLRNLLIVLAIGASFGLGALIFGGGGPPPSEVGETIYTCSMHPNIRQNRPGSCPICGMDLVPAREASTEGGPDRVQLSERARTLARIRTTEVRREEDPTVEIRLLGRIEADETALRTVTAWTAGRIERLHVNVTGQQVRRGQVVATVYSPELYAAHQDLITARSQLDRARAGASEDTARAALSAVRSRLRLLGVPDAELARLEAQREPATRVPIRSPFSGTVLERVATEGDYVQVGGALYRIADLSRLWVQLDAYERDLPLLGLGQPVTFQAEGQMREPIEGKVAFVDPRVDPQTRTVRVRVELHDPDGLLRPGMYVRSIVIAPAGPDQLAPLVIPASAPLFTGRRSLVYVEDPHAEHPTYLPRKVRLGPRQGEVYPVVSGLSEGERVVSRGAFALDADLQIQGGPSMMTRSDDEPDPWANALSLSQAQREVLAPVVRSYLDLQEALADDRLDDTREAARRLGHEASKVELTGEARRAWRDIGRDLSTHATPIGEANSLEDARAPFEGVSATMQRLLQRLGNPLHTPLRVAFCPMASGSEGASWIQRADKIDNAYFGHRMRHCGELREAVEPGAHLPEWEGP